MPNWLWWAPLGATVLCTALLIARHSLDLHQISETDAINRAASLYLEQTDHSGRLTDCVAIPGPSDDIWLTVICTNATSPTFRYPIDRQGRVVQNRDPQT